jgi:hypothetical protein
LFEKAAKSKDAEISTFCQKDLAAHRASPDGLACLAAGQGMKGSLPASLNVPTQPVLYMAGKPDNRTTKHSRIFREETDGLVSGHSVGLRPSYPARLVLHQRSMHAGADESGAD